MHQTSARPTQSMYIIYYESIICSNQVQDPLCVYNSMNVLCGLVSSVRRALASKLRGPGFKSWPGTVGGQVTIIMLGARPSWKLAFS